MPFRVPSQVMWSLRRIQMSSSDWMGQAEVTCHWSDTDTDISSVPRVLIMEKKKEKKKEKNKSPALTLLYLLRRAKWEMLKLKPAECSAQEHDRGKYSMCWRVVWEQQFAGLLSIIEKAAPSKCTVLFLALKRQTNRNLQAVCLSLCRTWVSLPWLLQSRWD